MYFYKHWLPIIGNIKNLYLNDKIYNIHDLYYIKINGLLFVSLDRNVSFNYINNVIVSKKVMSCNISYSSENMMFNILHFSDKNSILYDFFKQYGDILDIQVFMPCIRIYYKDNMQAFVVVQSCFLISVEFRYKNTVLQDALHFVVPCTANSSCIVSFVSKNKWLYNKDNITKCKHGSIIDEYLLLCKNYSLLKQQGISIFSLFFD